MRKCILSNKEYDSQNQFASYTVEEQDGKRSYIVQFVRGEGEEQFFRYFLEDPSGPGLGERAFVRRKRTINENDVVECLAKDGTRSALNIVPKDHLEAIINSFDAIDTVRELGMARALNIFCKPFKDLTGIDINPVEISLQLTEKVSGKKVEGRCLLL